MPEPITIEWVNGKHEPPKGMESLLLELLERAGITGAIKCMPLALVKGAPHNQGLTNINIMGIPPENVAVRIRAQPGDNETSQELLIYQRPDLPASELEIKLRSALVLAGLPTVRKPSGATPTSTPAVNEFDDLNARGIEFKRAELTAELEKQRNAIESKRAAAAQMQNQLTAIDAQIETLTKKRNELDAQRRFMDREASSLHTEQKTLEQRLNALAAHERRLAESEAEAALAILEGLSPAARALITARLAGTSQSQAA